MALPVVLFHASSGSDTQASGAGPGTAIFGTGASINGTTSIDLSADSPDLSGVATDGSAVLWVNSSSGRQFFKITGVNNGTKIVTVANAATPTESGRTWAIGGKRATFGETNSRKLFSADVLPGWVIETETAQSIGSALTCGVSGDTTTGLIEVRGASSETHPTITQTANAANFGLSVINYWKWKNLKLANSNGTKTAAVGLSLRSFGCVAENVIFGDATNKLLTAITRSGGAVESTLIDCEITSCTEDGIQVNNSAMSFFLFGCWVHDCTANGIELGLTSCIQSCLIESNGGDGISAAYGGTLLLGGNTVHGNTGDGLDTSAAVFTNLTIVNNNFTSNGNYGWRAASGQATFGFGDFNNYHNNTSGTLLNVNAGTNDLAVDPGYADAANSNFEAGTAVKALGFPKSTRTIGANQSATTSYVDIGAAQRQEAGGGSSVKFDGGMTGGMRG